jgi:hypothetical protein
MHQREQASNYQADKGCDEHRFVVVYRRRRAQEARDYHT